MEYYYTLLFFVHTAGCVYHELRSFCGNDIALIISVFSRVKCSRLNVTGCRFSFVAISVSIVVQSVSCT